MQFTTWKILLENVKTPGKHLEVNVFKYSWHLLAQLLARLENSFCRFLQRGSFPELWRTSSYSLFSGASHHASLSFTMLVYSPNDLVARRFMLLLYAIAPSFSLLMMHLSWQVAGVPSEAFGGTSPRRPMHRTTHTARDVFGL